MRDCGQAERDRRACRCAEPQEMVRKMANLLSVMLEEMDGPLKDHIRLSNFRESITNLLNEADVLLWAAEDIL